MSDSITVFNRRTLRLHRDRAADRFKEHHFLFREIGERLADRLDDVNRRFPFALDLGCHDGGLAELLGDRGGVESLVQCDLSEKMAARAQGLRVAADEEFLPFGEGVFDLVLSNLTLHGVNDLPGALTQIRRSLKPDGLFLAALFGGGTCKELRRALAEAEITEEGGLSPRVSPFVEIKDAGALLQRAGFALPVADLDTVCVSYPDFTTLLHDLRGMGEANAVRERRKTFTRSATMAGAANRYETLFGDPGGRLPATFQIIYLTAWAPDPSQPKPMAPGSASHSLAEALRSK